MNAPLAAFLLAILPPQMSGAIPPSWDVPPPPVPSAADSGGAQPPDVVILDKVAGCYGSVRFDHRIHVKMSSLSSDCRTCHHDLPERTDTTVIVAPRACRDCHDSASNITKDDKPGLRGAYHRQCLSCHKDWAHENACGFCHTTSSTVRLSPVHDVHLAAPRAEAQSSYIYSTGHKGLPVVTFHHDDHSQRFGLKCVDCHAGSTCGSCHGTSIERPVVNRQQSCYGCHGESRCVSCHRSGEREKFDHGARTGWFLRPGHASLACNECHQNVKTPERPGTLACEICHAKRWGGTEFEHLRTGVSLYGDHALFNCLDCHRGGNPSMLATCSSCHPDRPAVGERRVGSELDSDFVDKRWH